jgi:hypothetical protein
MAVNGNTSNKGILYCITCGVISRVRIVELLTLLEHLSSPPVFSGADVTRSLALCACFVDRCLSFCTFSFGNCVVCSSSIYGFWLPLWYLQTLLSFCMLCLWDQPLYVIYGKLLSSCFRFVCNYVYISIKTASHIVVLGERWTLSCNVYDCLIFGVLTPLSAIFQLYHGDQF